MVIQTIADLPGGYFGAPLSSILLRRDKDRRKLIILHGFHRLCAVYIFDEDAMIPCKII